MSFKSRDRKRRAKIAVANAKREHRDVMSTRYYLTLVKKPCRCSACGGKLGRGTELVYRHARPGDAVPAVRGTGSAGRVPDERAVGAEAGG